LSRLLHRWLLLSRSAPVSNLLGTGKQTGRDASRLHHTNCKLTRRGQEKANQVMSFFDSVKKSLGISKDKSASAGGGGNYDQFEITFTEEKLGLGIIKYSGEMPHLTSRESTGAATSCPVVTTYESRRHGNTASFSSTLKRHSSMASRPPADIQPGDLIIAIEGNPISSFEDFASIVQALGRPVRIRYTFVVDVWTSQLLTSHHLQVSAFSGHYRRPRNHGRGTR
jgi:hypothetical protein